MLLRVFLDRVEGLMVSFSFIPESVVEILRETTLAFAFN